MRDKRVFNAERHRCIAEKCVSKKGVKLLLKSRAERSARGIELRDRFGFVAVGRFRHAEVADAGQDVAHPDAAPQNTGAVTTGVERDLIATLVHTPSNLEDLVEEQLPTRSETE